MSFRQTDNSFLLRFFVFGLLLNNAWSQSDTTFTKHEQTRIETIFSETEADSIISCCFQCHMVDSCFSVSYNNGSHECLLSEIMGPDISENSVSDAAWTTYSIYGWVVLFRAVKGNGMNQIAWTLGMPATSNDPGCKTQNAMSCSFYRHDLVNNWEMIPHNQIKYGLQKDGEEVAYVVFNGTTSNSIDDWFISFRILDSSWPDLKEDHGPLLRVDFGNIWEGYVQSCDPAAGCYMMQSGYLSYDIDLSVDFPQFLYSSANTHLLLADLSPADAITISILV